MRLSSPLVLFLVCTLSTHFSLAHKEKHQTCRNVPGSAGYPKAAAWSKLNATIGGRLVKVVPTARYCASLPGGACTDAQWTSALFRGNIPGSMNKVCSSITQTLSFGSLRRGCAEQLGAGEFLPLIHVAPNSDRRLGLRPYTSFSMSPQCNDMWSRGCPHPLRRSTERCGYTGAPVLMPHSDRHDIFMCETGGREIRQLEQPPARRKILRARRPRALYRAVLTPDPHCWVAKYLDD
jgi:hypothetical protein